jgi:hypothetical protein
MEFYSGLTVADFRRMTFDEYNALTRHVEKRAREIEKATAEQRGRRR